MTTSRQGAAPGRTRRGLAALVALAGVSAPQPAGRGRGALDDYDMRGSAAAQVQLPADLRELSGLATTADGRVVAHADERAIVYDLDARRGTAVRSLSLGAPPLRGDFEGVAVADGRLFLLTSDGWLYEARDWRGRATATYTRRDTGLGASCELEGLGYDPAERVLLVGCKRPRVRELRGLVTVFRWSVDRKTLGTPARVSVRERDLVRGTGAKGFRPSAVERHPRTGHYVLVAGPERVLAEITPAGAVVAARRLDPRLHRQPEGLAFLGDSVLLVADEGGSERGQGTLTWYRRRR
jgi:hypothetical protein